ncbi:hypothetical protein [Pseudomonas beijingensis]|uniref:hypothetical protein n=1 Tax=Pseudomonas beijingensis TaxID=2954101 RepID=UPI0027361AD6|nr:hypothetical protein [Pseudomonas sp. FP2262]WLH43751.1 hypothetical protein PSH83_15260 [Pseudomonas sp. FP2262]
MASVDKKTSAAQARIDYLAQRREQHSGPKALDPPELLARVVDSTDGTLHGEDLARDLQVKFLGFSDLPTLPGDESIMYLQFASGATPAEADYQNVAEKSFPYPVNPQTDFPFELTLERKHFAVDGVYTFRAFLHSYNEDYDKSLPTTRIFDSTPPYNHKEPKKLTITSPITDAVLAANPTGVPAILDEYDDRAASDQYFLWYGKLPAPGDLPDIPPTVTDFVPNDLTLRIPVNIIREVEDGGCYALYALRDKAQNRTPLSDVTNLGVTLGTWPPPDLHRIEVPQATFKGFLDFQDAVDGVDAVVKTYTGRKGTDFIEVTWGTTVLPLETMGLAPTKSIRIDPDVLRSEYGAATGPISIQVSYRVFRGTEPYGSDIETGITVVTDFWLPGPTPTDPWPDPINGDIPLGDVFGEGSNTANVLTRAHHNKNANFVFELYPNVKADEIVKIYWNGEHVVEADYTVLPTDKEGYEKTQIIPWSYIDKGGNGDEVPVWYWINSPNSPNRQRSDDTLVEVNAVIFKPPAPTFPDKKGQFLNCDSLDGPDYAIRVQVPDLSGPPYNLTAGDEVTLHWVALAGTAGETPIDGAEKDETVILDDTTWPVTGFIWRVQPYRTHLLPTYDPDGPGGSEGRGRITYSYVVDGGETITSEESEARVTMFLGNGSCPLP